MAVTEVERAELVEDLTGVVSPKSVETLMKCVLPEGRDHLATKEDLDHLATKDDLGVLKKDLEVLEHSLRADFAELKAYVETSLAESRADFAELKAHVDASLAESRADFAELRTEFAELKAHVDASLAEHRADVETLLRKQTWLIMSTLITVVVSTWTPFLIYFAAT